MSQTSRCPDCAKLRPGQRCESCGFTLIYETTLPAKRCSGCDAARADVATLSRTLEDISTGFGGLAGSEEYEPSVRKYAADILNAIEARAAQGEVKNEK